MIGQGLTLEPHKNLRKFLHIYEGLTDIHAKFHYVRVRNEEVTFFL